MNEFLCPCNAYDCPYYDFDSGLCELENPKENCDDYAFAYFDDDEEEEEWQ